MLSTMRANNGYAGIHELASDTRVRAVRKKESIAVPKFEPKKLEDSGPPLKKFGPYREIGPLWETQSEALLVAFDDVLGRNVWIHRFHEDVRARPMWQLALNRPGQLYWLQGFRKPKNNWDAYEAPAGTSLYHWVKTRKRLSWEEMFSVLYSASTALNIGLEEGILPRQISLRHVWVDAYGQVKFLSFPVTLEEPDRAKAIEVSQENWNLLIHQMLLFGLEGRLVAMENLDSQIPRVPLPEYVRSLIGRICAHRQPHKLDALIVELKNLAERPAKITRGRRVGPLLVIGALPSFMIIMLLLLPLLFSLLSYSMPDWVMEISRTPIYVLRLKELEKTKGAEETEIKKAAIHNVLAFSYAKAKSSGQSRQFLVSFDKDSRDLLESSLRDYPAVSEAEFSEAKKTIQTDSSLSNALVPRPGPSLSRRAWASFQGVYPFATIFLGFIAIPALIFSFLLRGGALLHLFGIKVQTETGEKASRIRCLLRALVAWSPCLLFTPRFGFGILRQGPPLASSPSVQLTITVIVLVGAIFSVVNPERGIQDRITRTHLVPR